MKIENCAMDDIRVGDHTDFGANTVLIQITDPAMEPPIPAKNFHSIFQFEFLDLDDADIAKHDDDAGFAEFVITEQQAQELVDILKFAQEKELNVTVHCIAGVCRSGAVVDVAEMMGFEPTNRFRAPNLRVKHLMMKALGWTYDSEEKPYMVNQDKELKHVKPGDFGLW
jgi:predicted protein tyrosine phosphatase